MKEFFNKIINKLKSVDKGTLCRTILQVCAYANQIIAVFGSTSFASSFAYQLITVIITVVVTGVSYWYDNNWSNLAILLGDIWNMVKDGKITMEELAEFKEKHKPKDTEDKK